MEKVLLLHPSSKSSLLLALFAAVLVAAALAGPSSDSSYCRRDPSWILKEESCALQTDWHPRSHLWHGRLDRFEHQVLRECVADEMSDLLKKVPIRTENMEISEPQVLGVYPNRENPLLVEVSMALSEFEAAGVLATASCIRQYHFETHFQVRDFSHTDSYGGNNCTYMASYLQTLMPGVSAQLVNVARLAWKEAQWGNEKGMYLPDPGALGIRTTEHLRYASGSVLGSHADSESTYTVLVALSDPESYEQGNFVLHPDYDEDSNESIQFKPKRLSALVFLSESLHSVKPVTEGVRETFATEFWTEEDVPFQILRPSKAGFYRNVLHRWFKPPEKKEEELQNHDDL